MTFELGRAKFIIDFSSDQALHAQAEYYHDTTVQAQNLTKFLAQQLKVRESDVKNSASVMIAEEKRVAAEQAKIDKAAADDRKKTTQELLRYNQQVAKQEEAARKERARAIILEEKLIEKERLDSVKRQVNEEAIIRKRGADQRKAAAAEEAAAAKGGILGSGLSATRLGGTASTLLGFGAIGSGALIAHEAIVGLTEATLKQEQAQRSLNASFGATSILYKENAEQLAKQFNLITADVEQATTTLGALANQAGLSGEQVRKLSAIAIDNRAAFGGDLREAHRALGGVILGETEAYEKFGLVLQDNVLKNSNLLTESERRRFTTMDEGEKQTIRYRLVTEHWAEIQGAATQRVEESQGGFDKLNRAINEVAISLGGKLIPEIAREAGVLGDWIANLTKATRELELFGKARQELLAETGKSPIRIAIETALGGEDPLSPDKIAARAKEIADREDDEQNGRARRDAARKEEEDDIIKAENAARGRREADAKRVQEILEIQIKAAHDAELRRIDDLKRAAEEEQAIRLEAAEKAKTAELQALEDIENARKAAHVAEVNRIKKEKDEAIFASDERLRVEKERIETEQKAVKAAAEEQMRQLKITADALKKASELRRDTELERLETEKEARDRARTVEDRQIADSTTKAERALDDAHNKTLRRIEREGEALHKKNQQALRDIDNQEKKEDDRHRKVLQRIDDETKASLKEIDIQIRGIEDIQKARENARRSSDLNRKLGEAQLGFRQASGTGDPIAAAAAQSKLVSAIRVGDPTAIKKAQDELIEIVGHGDEAIKKAQEDLADAQDDIRDNDLKREEDAQKQKLQDEKDRVKDTADEEKRLEDNRDRQRKERLDKDKDAEKRRLDDSLAALEKKKEKEDDSNKNAKRALDDLNLYNRRKLEDKRKDEDQAYKDAVEAVQNRYKTEQDDIQETYYGEDHGYIPAIKRALDASNESYDGQREAAENRHRDERGFIDETFDHQLEVMQAEETENQNHYTRLVRDTRTKWDEIRDNIKEHYRAKDGKSGILDQYDEMKRVAGIQLDAVMQGFKEHKLGLTGPDGIITLQWKEALAKAKEYFDYLDEQNRKEASKPKPGEGDRPPTPSSKTGPMQQAPGGGTRLSGKKDNNLYKNEPTGQFMRLPTANLEVELGSRANSVAPGVNYEAGGFSLNQDAMTELIQDIFYKTINGTAAEDALRVWAGEGKTNYVGDSGTSFGPFQLNVLPGSLGAAFIKDTGIDLRDPTYPGIVAQIQWVANYVKANGWNNQWHGAPGYSPKEGQSTGIAIKKYDLGTMFNDPHYLMNMRTGQAGMLAELGPEMLLGRQATRIAQRMGVSATARPNVPSMDYMTMGAQLAHPGLTGDINNIVGDTMNYFGVAPENVMNQWRADQRRQRVLRGTR